MPVSCLKQVLTWRNIFGRRQNWIRRIEGREGVCGSLNICEFCGLVQATVKAGKEKSPEGTIHTGSHQSGNSHNGSSHSGTGRSVADMLGCARHLHKKEHCYLLGGE